VSGDTTASGSDAAHDWFPLDELTTRLGALTWVEQQLADVLDGWVATTPEAAAAVAFARTSRHHQWHSELLVEVLATSPQLEAHDRIVAPTTGWQRAIDQLRAVDDTQARLNAVARLIAPWLDREVGAIRDLANPVSDADHDRILGFVSLDHQADHAKIDELSAAYQQRPVDLSQRREIAEIDLS